MARSASCKRFRLSKDSRTFHSCLFLTVIATLPINSCALQVNTSTALIRTTSLDDGSPVLEILFGDPSAYVPQLLNGSDPSYFSNSYRLLGGYGTVETRSSPATLYYYSGSSLCDSTEILLRNGTHVGCAFALALSDQVTGFSLDWISGLLYWSDAGYNRIGVVDTNTYRHWRAIVDTNISRPQDVAVYPQQSYLFWSDLGIEPKIERLDLASDERLVLVSKAIVRQPTTLAIDIADRRLFWLDAERVIGSINFDGSGAWIWTLSQFSTISSFTLYQDYLLIGNKSECRIDIYNVTNKRYLTRIPCTIFKGTIDMAMWSTERQEVISSACSDGNGGCHHFCITLTSSRRRCLCAMGYFLGSDGFSCLTKPLETNQFLLVTDEKQGNLFQVDVDTGEVRAIRPTDNYVIFTPTAMDYDPVCRCVYWFDDISKLIRKTAFDNRGIQILMNVSGIEIGSLAFDGVTQTLLYVDYAHAKIGQILLSSRNTKVLLAEKDSKPTAIVLDTNNKLLYWSDCGTGTIERGALTNPKQGRTSVVTGLTSCINTFAIDFRGQVIYWGDEYGVISSANLDGSARKVILTDSTADYRGLALDTNYLYISDSNRRQIRKLDRVTHQISNLTTLLFTRPWALVFYTNESLSGTMSTAVSPAVNRPAVNLTIITIAVPVVCGSVILILITITVAVVIIKKRRVAHSSSRPPLPTPPISTYDDLNLYNSSDYDILGATGTINEAMNSKTDNEEYVSVCNTFSVELRQAPGRPRCYENGYLVPEDIVHQCTTSPSTATYDNVIPIHDDSPSLDECKRDSSEYI